jgi:serine/threonine protein kinase
VNQAGATRIGRYEILTLLGEGGMARVYLALSRGPVGFNKLVVVKQVRPELAWDQDFVTMFFDEARIASRLNHPNIVSTYEVVEEAGQYLLAMEFLEGQTLGEILSRLGRAQMPLDQHLWIICQVLAGLHYGHELADYDGSPLGIVHRDVSPSNVFVTYNGEVKLLDFGIAKSAGAATATQKGTVKGKIGYGAPEQFLARPVDARADVYAVGVMLWEALSGKRRKQAETPAAAYEARVSGAEPKIREVKPDVPVRLADICDRATATEPAARFATALQFQRALERYLESRPRQVGQRDLATLVNYHFKNERLQLRQRIESHLTGALSTPPSREVPAVPPPSVTPVTMTEAPYNPASHPPVVASGPPAPRPLGVGPKSLIAAGVVLVAVTVLVVALYKGHEQPPAANRVSAPPIAAPVVPAAPAPTPSPPPAAPPPPPTEAFAATGRRSTPPPATSAGRTVQLSIKVAPSDATVTLDGKTLTGNPFSGEFPADRRTHLVRVSAPGFAPTERMIALGEDTRLDISLLANRVRRPTRRPERPRPVAAEPEGRRYEPGMDLKRPAAAAPRRQIDEKDPYAP